MHHNVLFLLLLFYLCSLYNTKIDNDLIPLSMTLTCENNPMLEGHLIGNDQGYFTLQSDYYDNELKIFSPETIEEKTSFKINISNEGKTISASCNLWETEDYNIRTVCKVIGKDLEGDYTLEDSSLVYNNYNIILKSDCEKLKLDRLNDKKLPFVYSGKQVINIIDGEQDSYELKFNVKSYNNEKMILIRYKQGKGNMIWEESFDFEDCKLSDNKKQLICKLTKKDIERYIIESNATYYLISIIGKDPFYYLDVDKIIINYNIAEKKDVYVELTKMLKKEYYLLKVFQ